MAKVQDQYDKIDQSYQIQIAKIEKQQKRIERQLKRNEIFFSISSAPWKKYFTIFAIVILIITIWSFRSLIWFVISRILFPIIVISFFLALLS